MRCEIIVKAFRNHISRKTVDSAKKQDPSSRISVEKQRGRTDIRPTCFDTNGTALLSPLPLRFSTKPSFLKIK